MRLSAYGKEFVRSSFDREGTITGSGFEDGCAVVHWDGLKFARFEPIAWLEPLPDKALLALPSPDDSRGEG